MKLHNYDISGYSGLLRFELSLSKGFMKKTGYMSEEYLEDDNPVLILGRIILNANAPLNKYMGSPFGSGAMLSKALQKKYILKYCGNKKDSAKYKKIMRYRDRHNKKNEKTVADRKSVVRGYFLEMGISPLYTENGVEYIPSFSDLINEREDETIKRFMERESPR